MAHDFPKTINNGQVICFTPIDDRHRPTGACTHTVGGKPLGPVAALAICRHEGDSGFFLYYCDDENRPLTDTWHQTLEDARHQAETEYEGISETWVELRG